VWDPNPRPPRQLLFAVFGHLRLRPHHPVRLDRRQHVRRGHLHPRAVTPSSIRPRLRWGRGLLLWSEKNSTSREVLIAVRFKSIWVTATLALRFLLRPLASSPPFLVDGSDLRSSLSSIGAPPPQKRQGSLSGRLNAERYAENSGGRYRSRTANPAGRFAARASTARNVLTISPVKTTGCWPGK
jgi:hypothetical protein